MAIVCRCCSDLHIKMERIYMFSHSNMNLWHVLGYISKIQALMLILFGILVPLGKHVLSKRE